MKSFDTIHTKTRTLFQSLVSKLIKITQNFHQNVIIICNQQFLFEANKQSIIHCSQFLKYGHIFNICQSQYICVNCEILINSHNLPCSNYSNCANSWESYKFSSNFCSILQMKILLITAG